MTRIALVPPIFDDIDSHFDHIAQYDAGLAPQRIGEILEAMYILTHSPLIGCLVQNGNRAPAGWAKA